MKRVFVSIGGGEIRNKTTQAIDAYIASVAKSRITDGRRGYALFFPTASHDSNPYFNSFRKTYTSLFDMKSDIAILTKGLMTLEHVAEKIQKADVIYVGGGDTLYLMQVWRETGIDKLVWEAYQRGAVLAGPYGTPASEGSLAILPNTTVKTTIVATGRNMVHSTPTIVCL